MPASQVNAVRYEDLSPDLQKSWDEMHRISGEAHSIEVMANSQAALAWYGQEFYGKLYGGALPGLKLDMRTKELLRLRLSKGHGCHVCNTHNEITALEQGITHAQIEGIMSPTPGRFDARDQAVLDLAAQIELANMEGYLSGDLYERLKAWYDDGAIVEMGMIAAFLTGMAKFLFVFDLVTREATCPISKPAVH